MNLDQVNIAIRQRTVLESVDLSLPFSLRLGRRVYGRLALVTLLPAWLLCMGIGYAFGLAWGWLWLMALAMTNLLQGVFTIAAGRLMFEDSVAPSEVLRTYLKKLPVYAVGLVWTRTLIGFASLAFMLLLPVAWIRYAFAHEVLLLEGSGIKNLGARSAGMVKGQTGVAAQMLACLVGMTVGGVLVTELLAMGTVSFLLQLGKPLGSLLDDGGSAFSLLGLFAATPLVATARFLSYIDGRTRRDAWDVQVRFQQVRARDKAQVV